MSVSEHLDLAIVLLHDRISVEFSENHEIRCHGQLGSKVRMNVSIARGA